MKSFPIIELVLVLATAKIASATPQKHWGSNNFNGNPWWRQSSSSSSTSTDGVPTSSPEVDQPIQSIDPVQSINPKGPSQPASPPSPYHTDQPGSATPYQSASASANPYQLQSTNDIPQQKQPTGNAQQAQSATDTPYSPQASDNPNQPQATANNPYPPQSSENSGQEQSTPAATYQPQATSAVLYPNGTANAPYQSQTVPVESPVVEPSSTYQSQAVPVESSVVDATGTASAAQPSGSGAIGSCGSSAQTIEIQNQSGGTLMLSAGAPWTVGSCGSIASGSSCTTCQARGSTGGNLELGFEASTGRGSWIEGNWDTDAAYPCLDISFIPGYSVPIICTGGSGSQLGYGSSLCSDSSCSNCASGGGTWVNNACQNPAGDGDNPLPDGPTPAFFAPAEGSVYTYPTDTHLGYAPEWSNVVCTAYPPYGHSAKRRDIQAHQALAHTPARKAHMRWDRGQTKHEHAHVRAHESRLGLSRH